MELKFSEPEFGWLVLTGEIAGLSIHLDFADAPEDSLQTLLDSLIRLSSGSISSTTIRWYLEPDHCLWRFKLDNEVLTFSIFHYDARRSVTHLTSSVSLDFIRFTRAAIKAYTELESLACWTDPNLLTQYWSNEFPSEKLRELKKQINLDSKN